MAFESLLLIAALLLVVSIVASKAAARLGIPALLIFLLIGMLAGSDGPGGIYFDDPRLTQSLGVVALAYILFSGGLDTDWSRVKPMLWPGLSLATLGVVISALIVGAAATQILGLSLLQGVLLGAIISSTDAAAVFAILKSRGASLDGRLQALIELESGSNDPMAVFLTASLTGLLIPPGGSLLNLVPAFALQMAVGAGGGWVMGWLMVWLVNRLRLEYEGLYPVLTLSLVLLTYGLAASLGGNGFLAVYLAGLTLGNRDTAHKRSLLRFHDGIAWLMQIVMFLALGLLVFPSRLIPVAGAGLLMSGVLILVARPISVFVSLAFSGLTIRQKAMVSWVGLRGAVPIILATYPLLAGVAGADLFFNLVFFIVLTSVAVQAPTIPLAARWLRVEGPPQPPSRYPREYVPEVSARSRVLEVTVSARGQAAGRSLVDLGLPRGALVVLITRGPESFVPSGAAELREGDRLLLVVEEAALPAARQIVEGDAP